MNFTLLRTSLALASLVLCSCASQRPPTVYTAPSVAPVKEKITESKEHIVKVRELVTQLDKECEKKLPGWQSAYDQLQKENTDAWTAADIASKRADELQVQNDGLAKSASQESAARFAAVEKEKLTVFKYHRVKALLSAAGAALAAFLLFTLGGRILAYAGAYGAAIMVGGPAVVATLIFLLL